MRLPVVPTLTVVFGVPFLIHLGFWQLDRRVEKRAQLAAFEHPQALTVRCDPLEGPHEQRAGLNRHGVNGWAHYGLCRTTGGLIRTNLGWSSDPLEPRAFGHPLTAAAMLYQVPGAGPELYLTQALPPLQPAQAPSAENIPNNHLAYAIQWFAFATILPVIYAMWLRRWRRERAGR